MIKLSELVKEGLKKSDHDSLSDILTKIANSTGHTTKHQFPDGSIPDVLYLDGRDELFLGDAKNAENETVSNKETTERIAGYIDSFFDYREENNKHLGYISIITNDLEAAYEWKDWLNDYCFTEAMMSFEVVHLTQDVFVIINE